MLAGGDTTGVPTPAAPAAQRLSFSLGSQGSLRSCLLLPLAAALLAGCSTLLAVRGQQEQIDSLAMLGGSVSVEGREAGAPVAPIVVGIVVETERGEPALVDHYVTEEAGRWMVAIEPGTYRVAAFEDTNRDGRYDEEPAAVWRSGQGVTLEPGERRTDLTVEIPVDGRFRAGHFSLAGLQARGREEQDTVSLFALSNVGEKTTLDDPRFAREHASAGMWKPFDFVLSGKAGIYFLEDYDPERIPVLFVHGIGGTPIEFADLVEGLDRERFQPWVAYYPSGARLDALASWLAQVFTRLHSRFGFERVAVVAHSMGGLVARAFVLEYARAPGGASIETFVTISSPLGGMASAGRGVEDSPIVVRSWLGLAPGSAFLDGLFYEDPPGNGRRRRLPAGTAYHMLVGFGGGGLSGSSDGVVLLASQMRPEAQAEARSIRGFDATHTGILRTPEAVARVREVLSPMR